MPPMTLTNLQCKNAKPKEKPYKKGAGRGLYLEIMPNGSKYWRMKYRFGGKEKRLALGVYDQVSVKEAQERCTEARKLLDQGIDPSQEKKSKKVRAEARADNTFEVVGREWHKNFLHKWTERHAKTTLGRLERDIFPQHRQSVLERCLSKIGRNDEKEQLIEEKIDSLFSRVLIPKGVFPKVSENHDFLFMIILVPQAP